jgi:hypothetical protein
VGLMSETVSDRLIEACSGGDRMIKVKHERGD